MRLRLLPPRFLRMLNRGQPLLARREARLSAQGYRHVVEAFVEDWTRYIAVQVTDRLVKDAGDLAAHRVLRGYDALHLASALVLREQISSIIFLAFDRELMAA